MATPHKDRLLSDVGRTVRLATMTLTARRMCL